MKISIIYYAIIAMTLGGLVDIVWAAEKPEVTKSECINQNKTYVKAYRRKTGVIVKSHCRSKPKAKVDKH